MSTFTHCRALGYLAVVGHRRVTSRELRTQGSRLSLLPRTQLCISRARAPYQRGWLWSPSLTPGRESLGWHRTWPRQWPSLLAPSAPSSAALAASGHCYGPGVGTGDAAPGEPRAPPAESLPTSVGCACPGPREESCPADPKSKCWLKSDHGACSSPIFFGSDEFHSESNLRPSNCGLSTLLMAWAFSLCPTSFDMPSSCVLYSRATWSSSFRSCVHAGFWVLSSKEAHE